MVNENIEKEEWENIITKYNRIFMILNINWRNINIINYYLHL